MGDELLSAAISLSERGYKVFPCNEDKRPRVSSWRAEATTDPNQIERWFGRGGCLIAVPTGQENDLFVLDVDPEGEDWYRAREGELNSNRIHQTRRGRHLIYRFPSGTSIKTTTVGKIARGIDTRGDGGYVTWWPGSGFPVIGSLSDLQPPPQWLLDSLAKNDALRSATVSGDHLVSEGGRNDALISFCGRLRYEGDSEEQMLGKARQFNAQRFDPPLKGHEVRAVVASAARYPKGSLGKSTITLSEDSLAADFARWNSALRFVSQWGRWMVWDEKVWTADETLAVFDKIRRFVRANSGQKASLLKAATVAAVERLARADRRFASTPSRWDANDTLLNTQGGVVDLTTGELKPHDLELHMSKITSAAPGSEAPRWLSFLSEITCGHEEYQGFLQRVIGYSASGLTNEHALFFFFGSGSNGKSVFINTIHKVMGDYAAVASMETFTQSKFEKHPTDLAMLQGARLVFAQETESGRAWAESKIKSMTGGDPITARYMRQDFFTFEPKFKLLIAGNHKPRIRHADEAMRRRLVLLPFTRRFNAEERDLNLPEKLSEEMPGILQWIIDGALDYQRVGLRPPQLVSEATAEYFESEDLFKEWLDELCELSPAAYEKPDTLYESYKNYALAASEIPATGVEFRQRMENAGFKRGNSRAKGGRHWQGVSLKVKEVFNPWPD